MTLEAALLMADDPPPDFLALSQVERNAWAAEGARRYRERQRQEEEQRAKAQQRPNHNHPYVEFPARKPNGGEHVDMPTPLRIVSPAMLEGAPPLRKWNVEDWLPAGVVTGLYGDGGLGKSLLAQQLQTSMATEKPRLGLGVMQAPSLGVYCEDDDDELWRRQDAICAAYEIERRATRNVHWLPRLGEDNILMTFARTGVGQLTPFHTQVLEAALDLKASLVVVDTAADTYGGSENDRGQVRQFVQRALGSIALRIKGSVLCCAHPSRAGLRKNTDGEADGDGGSTGWSNTFRSRLFLTEPAADKQGGEPLDPNARILQRRKANYAARNDQIRLRWRNGVIMPEAAQAPGATAFGTRSASDVFLDLLHEHD